MKRLLLGVLVCALLGATGCATSQNNALYNGDLAEVVTIGVTYPVEHIRGDTLFEEGLEMALADVNAAGGVLGMPMEFLIRDDQNDATLARQIAQSFVDHGITAVIGPWSTNATFIAEDVYEQAGVVMVTPNATGMTIFERPYQYVFRMISNNEEYAAALAAFAAGKGIDNLAIYYSDDLYGRSYARDLEQALANEGITVIDRVSSLTKNNAERVADRWRAFGCEGVVVAAVMPEAGEAIRFIREMNAQYLVFGADNFDRVSFLPSIGGNPEGIYIATYSEANTDADFLRRFREAYGHLPDIFAMTAYESVILLRDAIAATDSLDGAELSAYIRSLEDYQTVSSTLTYNEKTQEFDGMPLVVLPISARQGGNTP